MICGFFKLEKRKLFGINLYLLLFNGSTLKHPHIVLLRQWLSPHHLLHCKTLSCLHGCQRRGCNPQQTTAFPSWRRSALAPPAIIFPLRTSLQPARKIQRTKNSIGIEVVAAKTTLFAISTMHEHHLRTSPSTRICKEKQTANIFSIATSIINLKQP